MHAHPRRPARSPVAALALGAGPVPACDAVVGPGNRFVTAAKQLVAGRVVVGSRHKAYAILLSDAVVFLQTVKRNPADSSAKERQVVTFFSVCLVVKEGLVSGLTKETAVELLEANE